MVTTPYFVPQSPLVTIIKELAKAKQTNQQFKKYVQMTQAKQAVPPAMVILTKLIILPKTAPTKTYPVGKKTVCVINKPTMRPTSSNPTKTKWVASVLKPIPFKAPIDAQLMMNMQLSIKMAMEN